MINLEHTKEKYPSLAKELDTVKQLQDIAQSPFGREMYSRKQSEFNACFPQLFEANAIGDEKKMRYTITKMELLHQEIIEMQKNATVFDTMIQQIEQGDFDKDNDGDDDE
jgi:hypothetical protein